MSIAATVLEGTHVRLEPLAGRHVAPLLAAAGSERELYKWTSIPQTLEDMAQYVATAMQWQAEGTALGFATVRRQDGAVVGSTRFFLIERWPWPAGHTRAAPDGCEIGYTWLAHEAVHTGANTEAKLLMLTHAFETWQMLRVCLHTDARNTRSRAAIERIGGKFEGILRAYRMAADFTPRDSARYSIVAAEWSQIKQHLMKLQQRM